MVRWLSAAIVIGAVAYAVDDLRTNLALADRYIQPDPSAIQIIQLYVESAFVILAGIGLALAGVIVAHTGNRDE